jgi:hypothetical protein
MNVEGLGIADGSLASLFGANSMEAWVHLLLDRRKCRDCKESLAADEGTMEFCGPLPHVEFIGCLCTPCWERREEIRRVRQAQGEGT